MLQLADKALPFLPREKMFWIVNVMAWILALDKINPGGESLSEIGSSDRALLFWSCLIAIWIAYIGVGIIAVLIFRHFYYRKEWGEKRLIASLPLAFLIALAAGVSLSFLVQLPVDAIVGKPFRIFEGWNTIFISGAFSYALHRAVVLTILFFLWLLAYWGISATLHARNLAFKSLALENSLKGARLNALSGQINSHFLFNALNNIRFMISMDANRAEESLVALSEILRHSLESSRKAKVLLSEELGVTKRYLSLMKNQMRDRLEYSIRGSQDSGSYLIPPMIIQMLAENAIKHGVEQIREGGRVDIHCSTSADKLRIEVRNTAIPPGSDSNVSLRKSEGAAVEGDNTGERGVGLPNISKRLTLLYGDKAKFTMSHRDDEFLVALELPGEKAE